MRIMQRVGLSLIAAAITSALPSTALAQKDARITSRNVAGYAELLVFDADQREIALILHADYMGSIEAAVRARQTEVEEFMENSDQGKRDPALREYWFKLTQTYENEVARLEVSFFGDLQLMLTEDQASLWPNVERLRRRETVLRSGWLSGENIDLIAMTHKVTGERPLSPDVTEALNTYELQLDRALITKRRVMTGMLDAVANPKRSLGEADYQEMGQTKQSMGISVRDINHRHARLIAALLPEDLGAAFHDEWLHRSFPRVYRESRPDRLFRAVRELGDLTSTQRESVDALLVSYKRERGAADKTLTVEIINMEDNPVGGGGKGGGRQGDGLPAPIQKAMATRRGIDQRYEEKVKGLLTDAQEESLPSLRDPEAKNGGKSGGKGR